jgi:hypothetical protein
MVVTRPGRLVINLLKLNQSRIKDASEGFSYRYFPKFSKMFPKLELHLHGLDPKSQYTLFLYMQKIDNYR